jgi:hypothetical protein
MYTDTVDYLANLAASRVALLERNPAGFSTKLKVGRATDFSRLLIGV